MSLPRTAISRSFATFSARSSCRLDTPGFRQASCILQTHNHAEVNPIVRSTKHQYRTYVRFTRAASTTVDRSQESDASDSGSKRTAIAQRLPAESKHSPQRLREFGLDNRVFIVTGGARGLGLTLAEALVEAGGHGKHATLEHSWLYWRTLERCCARLYRLHYLVSLTVKDHSLTATYSILSRSSTKARRNIP